MLVPCSDREEPAGGDSAQNVATFGQRGEELTALGRVA